MTGSPASDSASMNAILRSVGTVTDSFCSPSRGPTSTIVTRFGSELKTAATSALCDLRDDVAGGDAAAFAYRQRAHRAAVGRDDAVLHLHRLHDDDDLQRFDRASRLYEHLRDRTRHRRGHTAAAASGSGVCCAVLACLRRLPQCEALDSPLPTDRHAFVCKPRGKPVGCVLRAQGEQAALEVLDERTAPAGATAPGALSVVPGHGNGCGHAREENFVRGGGVTPLLRPRPRIGRKGIGPAGLRRPQHVQCTGRSQPCQRWVDRRERTRWIEVTFKKSVVVSPLTIAGCSTIQRKKGTLLATPPITYSSSAACSRWIACSRVRSYAISFANMGS